MILQVLYILPNQEIMDDPNEAEETVLHYLFYKMNILPRVCELVSIQEYDDLFTINSIQYGINGRTKEPYIVIWLKL